MTFVLEVWHCEVQGFKNVPYNRNAVIEEFRFSLAE